MLPKLENIYQNQHFRLLFHSTEYYFKMSLSVHSKCVTGLAVKCRQNKLSGKTFVIPVAG